MRGPGIFINHLSSHNYHPRSDAHSNAICRGILEDLLDQCDAIAGKAGRGEIVASLNHTVTVNYQRWNIDLALGPPPEAPRPPSGEDRVTFAVPVNVEVALEAKGVMTEHGKARHNRLRDLQAFHHHAHMYNQKVVAAGIVVVNTAEVYWSPTRSEDDVTFHDDIDRVAADTIQLYRNLPLRRIPGEGAGLEGAAVLAVRHDNLRKNPNPPAGAPPPGQTLLVTGDPAPQTGDPLNYATMIQRVCTAYEDRWG